jgi:nicotinamide-nucleotide amidase
VASELGERLLRAENPIVATYARADAVDVRISAIAEADRSAASLLEETAAAVLAAVGEHVWGHDDDTWPAVLGRELETRGWGVALAEVGTGGATARLFGEATWLRATRAVSADDPSAVDVLTDLAGQARQEAGASIGLAVRAFEAGEDTRVELAAVGPWGVAESSLTAFLGGSEGRRRAGLAAAAFLNESLRKAPRV